MITLSSHVEQFKTASRATFTASFERGGKKLVYEVLVDKCAGREYAHLLFSARTVRVNFGDAST